MTAIAIERRFYWIGAHTRLKYVLFLALEVLGHQGLLIYAGGVKTKFSQQILVNMDRLGPKSTRNNWKAYLLNRCCYVIPGLVKLSIVFQLSFQTDISLTHSNPLHWKQLPLFSTIFIILSPIPPSYTLHQHQTQTSSQVVDSLAISFRLLAQHDEESKNITFSISFHSEFNEKVSFKVYLASTRIGCHGFAWHQKPMFDARNQSNALININCENFLYSQLENQIIWWVLGGINRLEIMRDWITFCRKY